MSTRNMRFFAIGMTLLFCFERANAQAWGTGMYGAMQSCPYEVQVGEEAASIKEELEERAEELKDAKSDLSKLKSRMSSLKSAVSSKKDLFKLAGFDGEAFSIIDSHITTGSYSCSDYVQPGCDLISQNEVFEQNEEINSPSRMPANAIPRQPVKPKPQPPTQDDSRPPNPPEQKPKPPGNQDGGSNQDQGGGPSQGGRQDTPQRPVCGTGSVKSTAPFTAQSWASYCTGRGTLRTTICQEDVNRSKGFSRDSCERYLGDWMDKVKELKDAEIQVAELQAKVKELEAYNKAKKAELREAIRDFKREQKREMTEGGCVECALAGNGSGGGVYRQRASGLEIGANVALGLGAMYLGNQLNKYQTNMNARLGFPTQSYPSFGYGAPFFMGALYGAIGGSTGGGSFGCSGGAGSSGFGNGPYGMMGPFGSGSMYGPNGGGAFGYPNGMYGSPMGGGMYLPGMGPFGMAGPFGSSMCAAWPCPVGGGMMMSGGMMMPGGAMMGMPMGSMMGMPMGAMAGGGYGMPMGSMMGMGGMMGMPMGSMMGMGGMMGMPMGSMMGMGGMMGMPMGSMIGMGGMTGMGMDPSMMQMQMQMQQQMMQMQMQQYQQQLSMQQARYQQQMQQGQVIVGLTQELNSLMFKLQAAQMGMYSGGYIGIGVGGSFGGSYGGFGPSLPGQSIIPGGTGIYGPTTPGGTVLPGGTTGGVPSYR